MSTRSDLSNIASQTVFSLIRSGGSSVTFAISTSTDVGGEPAADSKGLDLTTITIPPESRWRAGLHWHEAHDEYLRVVQGRILVVREKQKMIVGPEDGVIHIEKGHVHEWMRADFGMTLGQYRDAVSSLMTTRSDGPMGEEVVVEEWTIPSDGSKQVFFLNLIGVLVDADRYWKRWTGLQIMLVCAAYDNFSVFVGGSRASMMSWVVTHSIFLVAQWLGWLLSLSPWYASYTPNHLRPAATCSTQSEQEARKEI